MAHTRSVRAALRCAALCGGVLCCAVLCCAVLCCAVLCCAVLCCAVLCCAVLCCVMLCQAVLCCAIACCVFQCCLLDGMMVTDLAHMTFLGAQPDARANFTTSACCAMLCSCLTGSTLGRWELMMGTGSTSPSGSLRMLGRCWASTTAHTGTSQQLLAEPWQNFSQNPATLQLKSWLHHLNTAQTAIPTVSVLLQCS